MSEEKIKVTSWPLTFFRKKGVFAVVVILLVMLLTYLATSNILFTVIAFFVLAGPNVSFLFPTTLEFGEESFTKLQVLQTKTYKYNEFKGFREGAEGLLFIKNNGKTLPFMFVLDEEKRSSIVKLLKGKISE